MAKSLIAVAFMALAVGAFASEFGGPDVVHLTTATFEEKTNDGKVYFIKFYAPWCGHCKRLAPAWKELASELKDNTNVAIAHVDCTTDREVCQTADVKGYPTLKAFYKGEELKAYRGQRDKDSLKSFLLETAAEVQTESA